MAHHVMKAFYIKTCEEDAKNDIHHHNGRVMDMPIQSRQKKQNHKKRSQDWPSVCTRRELERGLAVSEKGKQIFL